MEKRKVKLRNLILINSIIILIVASAFYFVAFAPLAPRSPLTIKVTTDKSSYDSGDNINITIIVHNPTINTLNYEYNHGPPFDVGMKSELGEWVDTRFIVVWWHMSVTIGPNERIIYYDTINTSYNEYIGEPLHPGNYEIQVTAVDRNLTGSTWIRIDGPFYQDPMAMVWLVVISCVVIGLSSAYLLKRKKKG